MTRKLRADEYEEHDGLIARIKDKFFGDVEDEDEEEGFGANGSAASPSRARKSSTASPVLQVHAARGSQITKRMPRSLQDAQKAAEDLKERRPVIVNLEHADDELARRVIDFISGVTYALNGFYERVGEKVFLFTPSNIIIADEEEVEPGGKGLYADEDDPRHPRC